MNRDNFPGLSPLWLISLALVLGTTIVVMIPFGITGGEGIKSSDWISFAGNVLAGVMTLIAAVTAWFAVQGQIQAQERAFLAARDERTKRSERREAEAKSAAITILRYALFASAIALREANSVLAAANLPPHHQVVPDLPTRIQNFKRMIDSLDAVINHFAVEQGWQQLSSADRTSYLALTASLNTIVTIYRHPPPASRDVDRVRDLQKLLASLSKLWREFDKESGEVFERDAEIVAHEPTP